MASPPVPRDFPNGLLPFLLNEGERIYRVHRRTDGPIWFGPGKGKAPRNRFDAPAGEYRTLYAARGLAGAFVETVLHGINRVVRPAFVNAYQWTALETRRPLQLAKLHDEGLLYLGTNADICAGNTYAEPRLLARDLFLTFRDCDGIAYRARHNNGELCYALFDRVAAADLVPVDACRFDIERRITDGLMRLHGAVWDTGPLVIDPKAAP